MNIFFLDRDPRVAAEYHCDKHCVKMITEYAQILSTVLRSTGVSNDYTYRKTHENHPCTRWAAQSLAHWRWLRQLALFLSQEYVRRYGRIHLATRKLWLMPRQPCLIDYGWLSDPPQVTGSVPAMADTVEAYRQCYAKDKASFVTWKNGDPWWFWPTRMFVALLEEQRELAESERTLPTV